MEQSEEGLVAGLLDAQRKAEALFAEIQAQSLIRPGAKESEINEGVYALAGSMYGISRYWHKRIVRAGRNTLAPYDENPPDVTVGEDDIVFLDFGPVFEEWEADFGRTYVVGNDPLKHKLRRDIEEAFARGKQYFHEHPEITAAELYAYAQRSAEQAGWSSDRIPTIRAFGSIAIWARRSTRIPPRTPTTRSSYAGARRPTRPRSVCSAVTDALSLPLPTSGRRI